MNVFVYSLNGGVCEVAPNPGAKLSGESDADFLARIKAKDIPADAQDVLEIDPASLPSRDYRDAWVISNGAVVVDKTCARARAAFVASAKAALADSDVTLSRVAEAVALGSTTWTASDVVAFVNWRRALRAIVSGTDTTSTTLPAKPSYPPGT